MGDQRSRRAEPSRETQPPGASASRAAATLERPALTLQNTIGNSATERLLTGYPVQRLAADDGAPRETPDDVYALSDGGGGAPLDGLARQRFEPALGASLDGVRIHTGPRAAAAARSVRALAYTHGPNIVFGDGQYQPGSEHGSRLLAHELAHFVQQRNGVPIPAGVSQPGDAAELAAESIARSVTEGGKQPAASPSGSGVMRASPPASTPIQRAPDTQPPVPILPQSTDAGALRKEAEGLLANVLVKVYPDEATRKLKVQAATYMIVGNRVTWYHSDGKLIDVFKLDPSIGTWNAGIYLRAPNDDVFRYVRFLGEEQWVSWVWPKSAKTAFLKDWMAPGESDRLNTDLGDFNNAPVLVVIPEQISSAKRDASAASKVVDEVKTRMQARVPSKGESTPSDGGDKGAPTDDKDKSEDEKPAPDKRTPQEKIGDPPDKLVVWSNEDGVYVNVWVDGAVSAVPVDGSENAEDLEDTLQDAADALREARDPKESKGVAGAPKTTGFVGKQKSDIPRPAGGHKIANVPEYPSSIKNYGSDTTVPGALNTFEMILDYTPAGGALIDQVTARMQTFYYRWELFNVTNLSPDKVNEAAGSAVGEGEQATEWKAAKRKMGQKLENVEEDTSADLEDLAESQMPLSAKAAWLEVIGISNVIQLAGSAISSFIDAVTKPLNEQKISFATEGDFLVRCVATPAHEDDAVYIRASSVATTLVRAEEIHKRAASVNDKTDSDIARLEKDAADPTKSDKDKKSAEAQLKALRDSLTATTSELGASALQLTNQRLAVAEELQADEEARKPRQERSPEVRLVAVQLELQHRNDPGYDPAHVLYDYVESLRNQKKELESRLKLTGDVVRKMSGANYHPRVTLVSEETGQVNELLMVLGEAANSTDSNRHYLLADVTTSNPHDRYIFEGESTQAGLAGHSEAIRKAFVDFRENNGYGRGTIAIRLPSTLEQDVGGPIGLEPEMRSAPGSRARVMQRLKDLATAAEIASLFVSGPAALAIGAIGGVAGAIVAIDSIQRRRAGVGFSWTSFETIMDITSIVGGAVGLAGPALGRLGKLPRWASKVERLQGMLHIYGIGQMGLQVIIIPVQLEMQLEEIDKIPNLSEGERAARRAEAYLGAVRSGLVTAVSAAQMGSHEAPSEKSPAELPEGKTPVEHGTGTPDSEHGSPGAEHEGGPVKKEGATPEGKEAAAPKAALTRVETLEPALGELEGEVKVVENPDLKAGSARVAYRDGEIEIEVGKGSGAQQVRSHVETAKALLRYKGPLGKIRQLLSKIVQVFTRIPGYGTQGFESRLEVRKLRQIIDTLQQAQTAIEQRFESVNRRGGAPTPAEKAAIEKEIEALEHQLNYHEALVDSLDPGSGYVAAYSSKTEALFASQLPDLRAVEAGLSTSTVPHSAKQIDNAAGFQSSGRLKGMDVWLAETAKVAGNPDALARRMQELTTAVSHLTAVPDAVVELTPVPGRGLFVVETAAGPVRSEPAAGTHAARQRNQFTDALDLRAFDAWATENIDLPGRDPEVVLAKMPEAVVKQKVAKMRAQIEAAEKHAAGVKAMGKNVKDPLNATFTNQKTRPSGVVVEWNEHEPADNHEMKGADKLAAKEGPVRFYGDNFPGIDGTVGDPPRPMQLKHIAEGVDNGLVRHRAAQALDKAAALNIPNVEVYVDAPNLDVADVQDHWNHPDPFDNRPPRPAFSGNLVNKVVVWCKNGTLVITPGAGGSGVLTKI